ncbi:MAG: hypothetical protein ABI340_07770 [Nitrososphaera sp.]|jgi:hypothetical protein
MGHIPTILVTCLAVALTILYFVMPEALHFTILVFVSAAWFLVAICWLAEKSAAYMHKLEGGHEHTHEEKKKLASYGHGQTLQMSASEISQARAELSADLESLQSSLKNKDKEIETLKKEISSLQTLVQIEKLKTELANLKTLAAKENTKKKK